MYTPPEFKITDDTIIDAFLMANLFGVFSAINKDQKIIASHVPFLLEKENDKRIFYTHVANGNELSQLENGAEVLMIFSGEHGYVSSSWYASVNVPTWNYQATHVYGTITRLTEEELYTQLKKLTAKYENTVDGHINPDELPQRMIQGYLQHITGFKITEIRTEAKFKLSQNRNTKDFDLIIEQLESRQPALAKVMKEAYPKSSFTEHF